VKIGGIEIITSVSEGSNIGLRSHLWLNDYVCTPFIGQYWRIETQDDIESFYASVGIDYWARDVEWVDA
jgi:hypothetical protein